MKLKLPTFIAKINPDFDDASGMYALSLVESPAIGDNLFLAFNDETKVELRFKDEEKHIVTGVVMLADTPIYRCNEEMGEYYILFDRENIQIMKEKVMKLGYFNKLNLQHNKKEQTNGLYLIEIYTKDINKGINPEAFKKATDGSLIASYKITDENLWAKIKANEEIKGFSLEGLFDFEQLMSTQVVETKKESFDDFIHNLIN
jgi:hypothetical protein